ncbi:glycoside hydrolase family 17 protein [Macroventuria anomochaeta]|uniref:Glycoside hydrolase family 17 protein n=1 Tax=Macroventuria anomochaeta TaxID=301207 RepID=A0ACB6S065_9PLEO|nr:glycoside hydrolase family 17 protein [Macroventuria anomochaeta]KAF2626907.1 glycoside hydrolase family 17 protein [Macroventuria anomochaeta]
MKASIVAASALVASVAAFEHKNHAGFHMRRGAYEPVKDEVCTVYTTVYVHALPSIVPNTTAIYEHSTPAAETSTSCTEGEKASSIYTPIVISTKTPEASQPVYPTVPAVPEVSKPAVLEYPTKPAVSQSSKEVPQPSKPATPEIPTKAVDTPKPAPSSSKAVDAPKPAPSSSKAADKPKPTGSYSSGGRIVTNGNKWAMTYTPYAPDGNCKTEADIKSDIKQIADIGFTTIRSYSTDCGVFEYVVPACQEHGLKIIYGIFLEAGGSGGKGPFSQYANDQLDDIKNNAPKDGIAMVIVGNECMFNNNCGPDELASYIDHVRETLQGAGFPKDIAITTTEPVGTWEEKGAALCSHIDVFTVQVHPYFTASISPDMAGDFAAQQLEQAAKVCPEAAAKGKYISEIGWPSAGNNNGKAVAGVAEQKEAMKKIIEKVGAEACLFSFKDDPWKHPGALGVEQHFGCADALSY